MGLRSRRYLRLALLLYGALNASLYANLLPLWDGFDEAFHYSFIQALSQRLELPVLGETHISYEVRRSLELAPVSHIMKRNIPYTTAFADYLQLSNSERTARRQLLSKLNLQNQAVEGSGLNYEAQQAPLSYGL